MNEVGTIGFDTAKNDFQMHGIDGKGDCTLVRRFRRQQVLPFFKKQPHCTVAPAACGAAHCRAREIRALGHKALLVSLPQHSPRATPEPSGPSSSAAEPMTPIIAGNMRPPCPPRPPDPLSRHQRKWR